MAGASFIDYNRAYREVHRGVRGIIPATPATAAGVVPLAEPKPAAKVDEQDETQRARETSDVIWRLNNYKTITCDCGTKLRVPPNFKESTIACPHCGRIHAA